MKHKNVCSIGREGTKKENECLEMEGKHFFLPQRQGRTNGKARKSIAEKKETNERRNNSNEYSDES